VVRVGGMVGIVEVGRFGMLRIATLRITTVGAVGNLVEFREVAFAGCAGLRGGRSWR